MLVVRDRDMENQTVSVRLRTGEDLGAMSVADFAARLKQDAIAYADSHRMMISLETHNEKKIEFYKNIGFKVYGIMKQNFPLKQYCMIREIQ